MTQPWLDDGDVQLYHGDVIETLRALPAGIAQTCVTSPPYWGLRDYSAEGQLGLEATPDLYVERMVEVFREVWRVLRSDGTVWLNLGDSYATGTSADRNPTSTSGDHVPASWSNRSQSVRRHPDGLKPKDLVGIPWRVAFALQEIGWYLRSDIIWSKPNPMPESVTDRPTKAHEYLFLLTKQPRYFYDADAIREPHGSEWIGRAPVVELKANGDRNDGGAMATTGNEAGRNRRSVWEIATQPFPEAHFATYPEALVRPCILAGTSERGECSGCGAPWQRVVERPVAPDDAYTNARRPDDVMVRSSVTSDGRGSGQRYQDWLNANPPQTTGWRASCSCIERAIHDDPTPDQLAAWTRPQTVLDPFIGSGTTAHVARKHGRRCIGIDLSAEYLEIAARRLAQQSLLAEESA